MKAAIVTELGKTPVYGDFKEPVLASGENLITVTAAALSNLTKGRAAGTHYSSSSNIPFVVGVDGVGRLADGRRVYFAIPRSPYGSMGEKVAMPMTQCVLLPEALDDVTAAAMANPGMSSWAALQERAKLRTGETVLINGATGAAGRLAIQVAKFLGAKKVIVTGRNPEVLKSLSSLGADQIIPLVEDMDALDKAFKEPFIQGVDVVVDYLWGKSAEAILSAGARHGKEAVPIRFVQVGSMSGNNITLPSAALRSSSIELLGSGLNSVPLPRLLHVIGQLFQAAVPAGFKIAAKAIPLSEVEKAWNLDDKARIVFTI